MAKFKVSFLRTSGDSKHVGTYETIDEAASNGWAYAYNNGYTRSSCETRESVIDSLTMRQFCLLGYGPSSIEIEEIAN